MMRSSNLVLCYLCALFFMECGVDAFLSTSARPFRGTSSYLMTTKFGKSPYGAGKEDEQILDKNRRDLWKEISSLERQAVDVLSKSPSVSVNGEVNGKEKTGVNGAESRKEAFKLLAKSVGLKKNDVFMQLASQYAELSKKESKGGIGENKDKTSVKGAKIDAKNAKIDSKNGDKNGVDDMSSILEEMYQAGLPPHIEYLINVRRKEAGLDKDQVEDEVEEEVIATDAAESVSGSLIDDKDVSSANSVNKGVDKKEGSLLSEQSVQTFGKETDKEEEDIEYVECEEVDEESTRSEEVTEKVRVRVQSFYEKRESDPENGQFMFRYKVAIFNDGAEPVQVVARMWEIERYPTMEKEVLRGTGILQNQPIISPGDVYAYESRCPIKLFPPKGQRVLASMNGAYTVCRGNMGQHNFPVKIGDFNMVIDEEAAGGKPARSKYW